jgi:hypothetical protein
MILSSRFALADKTLRHCQLFPIGFGDLLDPAPGTIRGWQSIGHMSSVDGHFVSFEGFTCRDDGEAIAKARRLLDRHDVELWSGERFVTRLSEKPAPRS